MDRPDIRIRALRSDDDFRQCVELQRATWGADYDDIVPPSILKVAQKVGGVAAGAFGERDELLGFVFGMAGVRNGRVIHWSDMLAVREGQRDRGVGQRLKSFQRSIAKATGATMMYWTYDPLVARNAHMNFNKLGVTVDEYVEDMYGASESDLHRGLGTDRFIVAWPLENVMPPSGPGTGTAAGVPDARILNPDARTVEPAELAKIAAAPPPRLRVEIPLDIVRVRDATPSEAVRWRESTRQAFQWMLANRYRVEAFNSDHASDRGYYLLTRESEVAR